MFSPFALQSCDLAANRGGGKSIPDQASWSRLIGPQHRITTWPRDKKPKLSTRDESTGFLRRSSTLWSDGVFLLGQSECLNARPAYRSNTRVLSYRAACFVTAS